MASPPDSPLQGIQSTGSLEGYASGDLSAEEQGSSEEELASDQESGLERSEPGDSRHSSLRELEQAGRSSTQALPESSSSGESCDARNGSLRDIRAEEPGFRNRSLSQRLTGSDSGTPDQQHELTEALAFSERDESSEGSRASRDADGSLEDEARDSPSNSIQAFAVDPTTGSDTNTIVSNAPPSPFTAHWGRQPSASSSQAEADSEGVAEASSSASSGPAPELGAVQTASKPWQEAEEDPWDAASSHEDSQPESQPHSLEPTRSGSQSAGCSNPGKSPPQTSSAQIPRRRSSTSGMIRGADRASEELAEDLICMSENTTSADSRFKITDTQDRLTPSEDASSLTGLGRSLEQVYKSNASLGREPQSHSLLDSSDPCFAIEGPESDVASVSEAETKDILDSLRSQDALFASDADSDDCLCEVMSDLGIQSNGSTGS